MGPTGISRLASHHRLNAANADVAVGRLGTHTVGQGAVSQGHDSPTRLSTSQQAKYVLGGAPATATSPSLQRLMDALIHVQV